MDLGGLYDVSILCLKGLVLDAIALIIGILYVICDLKRRFSILIHVTWKYCSSEKVI